MPTNDELSRRFDRHDDEHDELPRIYQRQDVAAQEARTLEVQLNGLEKELRALRDDLKARLDGIDERLRWAFRTSVAAFLLPIIAGLILAYAQGRI